MDQITKTLTSLKRITAFADPRLLVGLLRVAWRVAAAVRFFSRKPLTPASAERFERRLEQCTREAGRAILESTLNRLEPIG